MSQLKHDNIVGLKEVIETTDHICLVQEYCSGGDYLNLISESRKVSNI